MVRSSNPLPTTTNTQAELLNGGVDSMRIGAALLLRVMPGDELELSTMHYWENDTLQHTHSDSATMFSSLLTTLAGGAGGYSGNEGFDPDIFLQKFPAAGNIPVAYASVKEAQTDPSLPRAYMNYLVFDRHMRLVPEQSGALQITNVQSAWHTIELQGPLTIGQDGFVLVYVSDETDINVHFDQVKVKFYKGIVKQQQHYYPYGLCIKAGEDNTEPNKYKYQGKKMQDELGMQLYDFHARQYDPQIGKFWGIDPADQFPSGYTGMGNDPANKIDPTGMYTLNRSQPWAHRKWSDRYAPLPVYENDKDRHMDFEGTDMAAENPFVLGYFSRQGEEKPAGISAISWALGELISEQGKGGGFGDFVSKCDQALYNFWGPTGDAVVKGIDNLNPGSLIVRSGYGFVTGENLYTGQSQHWTESTTQLLAGIPGIPVGRVAGVVEMGVVNVVEKNAASTASRVFEVGIFKDLKGAGQGLHRHHVGQAAIMEKLIPGYNRQTAPAILVPKVGHTIGPKVISTNTKGFTNARQVLARDIRELRRVYPNIPNSSLQQLIQMNKTKYGKYFLK